MNISSIFTISVFLLGIQATPVLSEDFRKLSVEEKRKISYAIGRSTSQPLSTDPSCADDPTDPRPMLLSEGLARYLFLSAADEGSLTIAMACGLRSDYPRGKDEEYCRMVFKPHDGAPYGFIFRFDWAKTDIIVGSIECIE